MFILKEHNNKMIPNSILLYPWINASLSHHQTSFYFWYMKTSTKTHSKTMCRDWEATENSGLIGVSSSNPSSQAQRNMQNRQKKYCKGLKGKMIQRKQCLPGATGLVLIWTHRVCGIMHRASTCSRQTG